MNRFWMHAVYFVVALSAPGADSRAGTSAFFGEVTHVPRQPRTQEPVTITARVAPGVQSVSLQYQLVNPGAYIELKSSAFQTNWISVLMTDKGVQGDGLKGDRVFTVVLPGALQIHRRMVRYRMVAMDAQSRTNRAPDPGDSIPNFAYFVYDGIPAWHGAIQPKSPDPKRRTAVEYGTNVMRSVQTYHLLGRKRSVENATWNEERGGKDYLYTGTLIADGEVYDHIRYRARGGVWRFAMGKNMWKIDFNKGHPLEARDDYGRPYPVKWGKVNLRACIDQADYGMRGNQGLFEAVGFRLFNLCGVESPATHWVQLRIIDEAAETPDDQYHGDFWGLYLAIENEDGRFLKQHGLPDGNLYKMEYGDGTLQNHGPGAVTNKSDLHRFVFTYQNSAPSETWWRTNLDLPRYYSYRSILECIHHYDVDQGAGKNYDYFLNPATTRWQVIPWDIDLSWADHMYGGGDEPFRGRVLTRAAFRLEYQNRLREIRDLLYNTNQAWALIDECAALIADPAGGDAMVGADRAKWDYHPVMAMGGKAGQGLFYESAATKDFPGMVQLMKEYVRRRSRWIDFTLLRDPALPSTPTVSYVGAPGFPSRQLLFRATEFKGTNAFASLRWRLGEVAGPLRAGNRLVAPGKYEITPVWESAELATHAPEFAVPGQFVVPGRVYRLRARMKDNTGRWSHWSAPVEFAAGK